jgi:uncharacterized protein (TIRG00374 family)
MRLSHLIVSVFFLAGLCLLGSMVWRVGVVNLLTSFQAVGFWIVPWILLEIVPVLLHTGGWAACFSTHAPSVPFWRLFVVRLAGSAINQVTPTATIGGEVVKVLLLESTVPRAQATASVVIGKASFTIAQIMHFALGTLYLTGRLPLPMELQLSLMVTLGFITLGLVGFVAFQRYGLLSRLLHWLSRYRIAPERCERWRQHLLPLEAQMTAYYVAHPWRFVGSLGLHFLAFAFTNIQNYLLLRLLLGTAAPGFPETIMVTVTSGMLDQMFFFVPGGLGTFEGIRFTMLATVGVAHVYGLAFGLISRLEGIIWNGLGLLAYAWYTRASKRHQPIRRVATGAEQRSVS